MIPILPPRPKSRKGKKAWGAKRQEQIAFQEIEHSRRRSRKWKVTSEFSDPRTGERLTKFVARFRYNTESESMMFKLEDDVTALLQKLHRQGGWQTWAIFANSTNMIRVSSQIGPPLDTQRFFWRTLTGASPSAKLLTRGMLDIVGLHTQEGLRPRLKRLGKKVAHARKVNEKQRRELAKLRATVTKRVKAKSLRPRARGKTRRV